MNDQNHNLSFNKFALDVEDQGGVGRNVWRSSSSTVAKLGRDDQLPLAAHLHAQHAHVPALDDLPGAQLELERLPVLEAVKLLVVGLQSSLVVHPHHVAWLALRPAPFLHFLHLEAALQGLLGSFSWSLSFLAGLGSLGFDLGSLGLNRGFLLGTLIFFLGSFALRLGRFSFLGCLGNGTLLLGVGVLLGSFQYLILLLLSWLGSFLHFFRLLVALGSHLLHLLRLRLLLLLLIIIRIILGVIRSLCSGSGVSHACVLLVLAAIILIFVVVVIFILAVLLLSKVVGVIQVAQSCVHGGVSTLFLGLLSLHHPIDEILLPLLTGLHGLLLHLALLHIVAVSLHVVQVSGRRVFQQISCHVDSTRTLHFKTNSLALVEGNVQGLVERLQTEIGDDELLAIVHALHHDGGDLLLVAADAGWINASLGNPEGQLDVSLVPLTRLDVETPEYVPADAVHADF